MSDHLADGIYPMGACPKHGPLLSVNGKAQCIPCVADANKPALVLVNGAEDPGAEFFQKGAGKAQHTALPQTLAAQPSYDEGLQEILGILSRIPMPASMKQYKLLMSVKQKIESALQEG